jgi:hypothetical protein
MDPVTIMRERTREAMRDICKRGLIVAGGGPVFGLIEAMLACSTTHFESILTRVWLRLLFRRRSFTRRTLNSRVVGLGG